MKLVINGEERAVSDTKDGFRVPALLNQLGLGDRPVLVELNGEAVLARELEETELKDGDVLEIIRMVAGG